MAIRNKLMILLLSVSLIPLVAYFVLDISFSRIVRGRIQKTLGSAVENRARETLIQTIDNYQEKLIISAQGIRYGLRYYADQVEQIFSPDNINPVPTDTSYKSRWWTYLRKLNDINSSRNPPVRFTP